MNIDLVTCTVEELVDSFDGFDLSENGLWTGATFREYVTVSIQGGVFGHSGNHYFIATSDNAPNRGSLRLDTANFDVFRAELIRLLDLPQDELDAWAAQDDDDDEDE